MSTGPRAEAAREQGGAGGSADGRPDMKVRETQAFLRKLVEVRREAPDLLVVLTEVSPAPVLSRAAGAAGGQSGKGLPSDGGRAARGARRRRR